MIKKYISKKSKITAKHSKPATKKATQGPVKTYTYLVRSVYYKNDFINKLFAELNTGTIKWVPAQNLRNPINYIYLDAKYNSDSKYYSLRSDVRNIVAEGKRVITLKNNIINSLLAQPKYAKYVMNQIELDLFESADKLENAYTRFMENATSSTVIYIFKPITEFAGKGIKMIENVNMLTEYIREIKGTMAASWGAAKQDKLRAKMRVWVLQEYIINPLLYNGHKFHIRHYFYYVPGGKSFYLATGEIAPAKNKYIQGDWQNKDIHDTHFYGSDGPLFPASLHLSTQQLASVNKQIAELYTGILEMVTGHGKCYKESKSCYEIFGVDLMLTDDYKLKLLEVNEKIGMPSERTPMSKILLRSAIDYIVYPALKISSRSAMLKPVKNAEIIYV